MKAFLRNVCLLYKLKKCLLLRALPTKDKKKTFSTFTGFVGFKKKYLNPFTATVFLLILRCLKKIDGYKNDVDVTGGISALQLLKKTLL